MEPTSRLPFVYGKPTINASIKVVPEDFIVEEILSFEPTGSGEHKFVHIEKWGENTDFIARQIARFTGIKARDIGFAGLKDRHGLTKQWFSVQLPGKGDPDWSSFKGEGFRVIGHTQNDRKLRRGALKGNRFTLRVRLIDPADYDLESRLQSVSEGGVPNYFGPQRFGRHGDNVEKALEMLDTPDQRMSPHIRGILLSSVRSEIFNQILASRVRMGNWNQGIAGDIFMFPDSKSHFSADPFSTETRSRIDAHQIHPSGPLVGKTPSIAGDVAGQIESEVMETQSRLVSGLAAADLESQRRPYRLVPEDFSWTTLDDGDLQLRFNLPAGSYATTVLRELFLMDASQTPEV